MASLIEDLITVLVKEEEEYKNILDISKEKTEIIVSGNSEELKKIVSFEQEHLDLIVNLEKKRQEVVNDIAIVLNKDVKTLNIKGIIQLLKGQREEQRKLSEARDGLHRVLEDLQKINELNKNLIKESLEMNEFNINVIKSLNQIPETANYSRKAANISNSAYFPSAGKFDAKQ